MRRMGLREIPETAEHNKQAGQNMAKRIPPLALPMSVGHAGAGRTFAGLKCPAAAGSYLTGRT